MVSSILPGVLGPQALSMPIGTLLEQISQGAVESLREDVTGRLFVAFLQLNVTQAMALLRGDPAPLNAICSDLKAAAKDLIRGRRKSHEEGEEKDEEDDEESTREARAEAAASVAKSLLESLVLDDDDFEEGKDPREYCLEGLTATISGILEALVGSEALPPPQFGPDLMRRAKKGAGRFFLQLEQCLKNGEAGVKRVICVSATNYLAGDGELGDAAALVSNFISRVLQQGVGSIMAAAREEEQGEGTSDAADGKNNGTNEKHYETAPRPASTPSSSSSSSRSGWMEHLSPDERKQWSRVISRDVKRQQSARPRSHSRAYESGGPNAKRRRVGGGRRGGEAAAERKSNGDVQASSHDTSGSGSTDLPFGGRARKDRPDSH